MCRILALCLMVLCGRVCAAYTPVSSEAALTHWSGAFSANVSPQTELSAPTEVIEGERCGYMEMESEDGCAARLALLDTLQPPVVGNEPAPKQVAEALVHQDAEEVAAVQTIAPSQTERWLELAGYYDMTKEQLVMTACMLLVILFLIRALIQQSRRQDRYRSHK